VPPANLPLALIHSTGTAAADGEGGEGAAQIPAEGAKDQSGDNDAAAAAVGKKQGRTRGPRAPRGKAAQEAKAAEGNSGEHAAQAPAEGAAEDVAGAGKRQGRPRGPRAPRARTEPAAAATTTAEDPEEGGEDQGAGTEQRRGRGRPRRPRVEELPPLEPPAPKERDAAAEAALGRLGARVCTILSLMCSVVCLYTVCFVHQALVGFSPSC
jgi:hypothetical protein